jgi:CTP synthase (UTP-ammonia lyase)
VSMRIALVGDFNPGVIAHQAIPRAIALAAKSVGDTVEGVWTGTAQITSAAVLDGFDGIWCVPASPYASMNGALTAIRLARETGRPFLGTCGGFQHAIVEYARHVLGWADADHAETSPDAARAVIVPLACSLVEVSATVGFSPGSRLANAYGDVVAQEGYHCNYGLAPRFAAELTRGPLRATCHDAAGDVRGVELAGHPFFVATLFQPERAALRGEVPPIVRAFVEAMARGTPHG